MISKILKDTYEPFNLRSYINSMPAKDQVRLVDPSFRTIHWSALCYCDTSWLLATYADPEGRGQGFGHPPLKNHKI